VSNAISSPLAHLTAHRYVQPLREGGSLPAVVDTDHGLYVVKFRGAGQGAKALIAELITGMLAHEAGLRTPALALVELPEPFGRSEPDPEIQDILRGSRGVNVGMRYLDGAFNFAVAAAEEFVTPGFASRLVWFDAFLTNPDRTHRNTNLLVWNREVWLIDHGASLYMHHDWQRADSAQARAPFGMIRDHVLLGHATELERADADLSARFGEPVIRDVLAEVPDSLLLDGSGAREHASANGARERYAGWLLDRLASPRGFVEEAIAAHTRLLSESPVHLSARR
jgi:hypothetical protein